MKGKRIFSVCLMILFVLACVSTAFAQGSDSNMVVNEGQVIQKDFFAVGDAIKNSGEIRGDVYMAGGDFQNEGLILGDVIAASGSMGVGGSVQGDLRLAAGNMIITGEVGRNVTALAGDFVMTPEAAIDGSVHVFSGNANVDGVIGGDLNIASGQTKINGTIKGDVSADVEQISFGPNAKIEGNLTYTSETKIQIPEGIVGGEIRYNLPPMDKDKSTPKEKSQGRWGAFSVIGMALKILTAWIVGALMVWVFGGFIKRTTHTIQQKPWHSVGIGLVFLIVVPIAAILLMITVVGIPLAVISLAIYGILFYLAKLPVALWLGNRLLKNEEKPLLPMLLGILILSLISYIPYLGAFVSFVVLLIGLGTYVYNLYEMIRQSKAPQVLE